MPADFAETSRILSNPSSADISDVGSNVDAWTQDLAPLGSAGQTIVDDLNKLKTELTASSPDGAKIGRLMSSLGQATTQNAGGNSQLEDLGRQLSKLGS